MALEIRGTWDGSRGDEIVKAVLLSLSDALLMCSPKVSTTFTLFVTVSYSSRKIKRSPRSHRDSGRPLILKVD